MNALCSDHTRVFNIQKYSVHDGPGIRTIVFLQGCPLQCPWCANPEGRSPRPLLSYNESLCHRCGRCTERCPQKAITLDDDGIHVDRSLCNMCGACVNVCRSDCYRIFGEERDVDEVLREVEKDETFYFRSGGGLTVSGGEPLAHPRYLLELLRGARERLGINTAIETTFCAPEATLRSVIDYIDHIICDIKIVDSARSRKILGVPSEQILSNIRLVANEYPDKNLLLRTPIIPGYTDTPENLRDIAAFINGLDRPIPLELLPYHEFGKNKYTNLGLNYEPAKRNVSAPSKERMEELAEHLRSLGVTVIFN